MEHQALPQVSGADAWGVQLLDELQTCLNLLQRDAEEEVLDRDNFDSLRELIGRCHETEGGQRELLRHAAVLVRSLYRAGIIKMERDTQTGYHWAVVDEGLQWDFSLFQALALYLVEAIESLDPEDPEYALDVLTLVEAILENPRAVLYRQVDKLKGELIARLKADRDRARGLWYS